jgi:ABC-type nitrate/sulfonate/bicarbonate transport system ATPase subunit
MRQRAAFLRTSLANKGLVLLDEPFAALDVLMREQLQAWLSSVLDREKATLILVTHSVEEALLLANRVVVLGPAPGTPVLEEPVAFAGAPFEEKPYLPEFLAQKKRILSILRRNLP